MAQEKSNKQNQQFIGQQTIDHQYFEQFEASRGHKHPDEWMKLYADRANETKKEIISLHEEYMQSVDSLDAAKHAIRSMVHSKMQEQAKAQPDEVAIAALKDSIHKAVSQKTMHAKNIAMNQRKKEQKYHEKNEQVEGFRTFTSEIAHAPSSQNHHEMAFIW